MTAPVPGITLTFEEGTDGAPLAAGGAISSVSSPAPVYSAAAKIHGNLGLTATGTSGGPNFIVPRPAGFADVNHSNTVSIYFVPVIISGGALQICALQKADNSVIGLLRANFSSTKFEISVNGVAQATSALTWAIGTKYRLDVSYDGATNTFTVKIFAGANFEGSVPDDQFTATGSPGGATPGVFDHWFICPSRSSTAGCQGYLDTIRFYDGVVTPAAVNPPVLSAASVVHRWVGAPSAGGFRLRAKLSGASSVKLAVSRNADMSAPTYSASGPPDANGYVDISMSGLVAATRYYYQLVDTPPGGTATLLGTTGRARTLPSSNSHRVAFGSCITTNATDPTALNDVVGWDPDLFIFLGDFDYTGTTSTDVNSQRVTYESQIQGAAGMANLIANVPWAYATSDHETGPDNGDSNNAYTAANISAYKQIVPTYPLADTRSPTVGRYQSWVIGRVRYILLDIRNTDRSPGLSADSSTKTMLGATQKAWLKARLLDPEPVKVILSDVGWMGAASTSNGEDKWWSYSTERQEISSFIAANNVKCLLWHGDSHALGVATPAKNTWGGFPVYCSSPMRNTGGGRNLSTFSSYFDNGGAASAQYARVTVTDTGTAITFTYSGWDALAQVQRVTQTDVFNLVDTTPPTVPVIVSATGTTPTTVDLSWSASTDAGTGVASYQVKRNGAVIAAAISSGTSFSDTGLSPLTAYTYSVSAVDVAGNRSADSDPLTVRTPALPDTTAPTVPTLLVAKSLTSDTVTLNWNASSDDTGVASYRVIRNGLVLAAAVSTTTLTDNTVQGGTQYIYTVSAVDAAGNRSAESGAATITTPALPSGPGLEPVPGLTQIVHRLLDFNGNPISGQKVTITLMLRLDVAPSSYQLNVPDQFVGNPIARYVEAISDSDGFLRWNLVPNDQIVPSGTYYEVFGLGPDRTFLYISANSSSMELSECTLTLVDLNSSNLVLVQGPRGRSGDDTSSGITAMPATTTTLGGVKLTGDLGGTADAPTVPSLADKANLLHTHHAVDITDASPVGKNVLTAADAPTARGYLGAGTSNLALGTTPGTAKAGDYTPPDAAAGVKGLVKLTGDFGGTADAPTVPGLATKANASHTHSVVDLTATGTRDSTKFLRGDNTWAVPSGGSSGAALVHVAATVSTDATLADNTHTPVSASGGNRTMTLPTGASEGDVISVEKEDATANTVTISGSIRGAASTVVLYWQFEDLLFRADSSGSWWPIAGHKTKSSLDAAYLRVKNSTTNLSTPATDYWQRIEILDDGSATASWPNRFEAAFTPAGGTRGLTTYLNEYGELRGEPAKSNTVAARWFTKHAPGDAAHSVNVIELMDDRTTRTLLFGVDSSGYVIAPNVPRRFNVQGTAPASPQTGDVWIDTSA